MDNICQKWRKVANLDLSDLEKWPLEWFNQIQLGKIYGKIRKIYAKIEKKLLTSFWENCPRCKKGTNLDLSTFKNYH